MEHGDRAVRNVGENMQQVSGSVRRLRDFVQDVGNHTTSAIGFFDAGVKTHFGVLLKALFRGGAVRVYCLILMSKGGSNGK